MKTYFFFIMGIAMPIFFLNAQTLPPKILSIGDTVPNFKFTNLLNYKQRSASLSDFKGKIVVLDFWATWCPPCVSGLVDLSELQKEFKDDLMVMPIANGFFGDTEAKISAFLKKRGIALPTCRDDSMKFNNFFPHKHIPHSIIIDKNGIVKAITKSSYITSELILAMISGKDIDLPVKADHDLEYDKPLFSLPKAVEKTIYHSQITGFLDGYVGTSGDQSASLTKMIFFNHPVAYLYAAAYQRPEYMYCRIIADNEANKDRLIIPDTSERVQDEWLKTNGYCYELTVPSELSAKRFDLMKNELDIFFGSTLNIHPRLEKRKMHCLKIINVEDTGTIRSKSIDQSQQLIKTKKNHFWLKVPMEEWVRSLNMAIKTVPVINGSNYTGPISIGFNTEEKDYIKELKKAVQSIGLRIEETIDDVEVIVL